MLYDLVIRGGSVFTGRRTIYADIAIDGEHIVEVGPELPGAKNEINAFRLDVVPGVIDVHVHFNEPGRTEWEGAETGSRALAAGGGTLFFDMPLNSSPCTVDGRAFDEKRRALEAASITDFGLWGGLIPGKVREMEELAQRGVVGFKAFLCDSGLAEFPCADDRTLYEGMREAARLGLPVAVHAESEETTKGLTRRIVAAGRNDIAAFLESRPVIAEVDAITRAGAIARETGCKLHIVHISSGRGVAAALEARAAGADISLETCPHYLFFTEEDVLGIGAAAKCAPPLRGIGEQSALREALFFGKLDVVASDHSPCPPEMKQRENFFEVWGGIAGVQWTIPALIELRYHVPRIAQLTSVNCARRFDIPKRGAIETGSLADITIIDVNRRQTVREEDMFQRHRMSPYIGMELEGVIRKTIRRGEVIYSDGTITARTKGRLVRPERTGDA